MISCTKLNFKDTRSLNVNMSSYLVVPVRNSKTRDSINNTYVFTLNLSNTLTKTRKCFMCRRIGNFFWTHKLGSVRNRRTVLARLWQEFMAPSKRVLGVFLLIKWVAGKGVKLPAPRSSNCGVCSARPPRGSSHHTAGLTRIICYSTTIGLSAKFITIPPGKLLLKFMFTHVFHKW